MSLELVHKPSEDQYLNCIRCGLCLAVCPTYRQHLVETASPRGRVALARKGMEGELALTPNLIEQMYACLDCLACNEICPVGIRPADLALEMRRFQEQLSPRKWKKVLFEGLLQHSERLEAVTWPVRLYEQAGFHDLLHRSGLHAWLPGRLRDLEGMLPHLPRKPLRRSLPHVSQAIGESRFRVGFFLGCAQSLLFAEESRAALRVLNLNGCTVITPNDTVCCGMPALGYGQFEMVRQQACQNIDIFERLDPDVILTDCATCGSTLKDYGKMLEGEEGWQERAARFSSKVRDICEFLVDSPLREPTGRIEARVTYHDPCHLRRAQGVWRQPRQLLQMIDGLEFVELPEADWCCGSAGSQLITHYQTSSEVLQKKIDNLSSTRADTIASGCPGCRMQLNAGISRQRLDVQVVHPVTLLARAYSMEDSPLESTDHHPDKTTRSEELANEQNGIKGTATSLCQLEEGD